MILVTSRQAFQDRSVTTYYMFWDNVFSDEDFSKIFIIFYSLYLCFTDGDDDSESDDFDDDDWAEDD